MHPHLDPTQTIHPSIHPSNPTNIGITLRHIPDPPIRRIPRHILRNPQIPHIQITHVKHGNLKIHIHGPNLPPRLGRASLLQRHFNLERLLRPPWKFLHSPQHLLVRIDKFRRGRGGIGIN